MEITRWSHSPSEAATDGVDPRRWWSPGILGLIGTLLVHSVVLQSVILGTHAQKIHPPDAQGPSATLIKSATEPAEALILLELPSEDIKSKVLIENLASAGSAPKNLLVTLISPDPLPHVDIPPNKMIDITDTAAPVDSGDPAGRALLFSRYSGQIQARIERAWRRPRSPVNEGVRPSHNSSVGSPGGSGIDDDSFRCQVRILQDGRGAIQAALSAIASDPMSP